LAAHGKDFVILAYTVLIQTDGRSSHGCDARSILLSCVINEIYIYRVGQKYWTCLSVDNSAMVTRKKACDMSKILECCRQKQPNLHSKSFKYYLPNLPKSSSPLKLGICLHSHMPEFIELKTHCQKVQV